MATPAHLRIETCASTAVNRLAAFCVWNQGYKISKVWSAPAPSRSRVLGAGWSPAALDDEGPCVACCCTLLRRHVLALVLNCLFHRPEGSRSLPKGVSFSVSCECYLSRQRRDLYPCLSVPHVADGLGTNAEHLRNERTFPGNGFGIRSSFNG